MGCQGSQSDSYLEMLHFSSTSWISRKMAIQWVKNKGRHPKAQDVEQEAVKTRPGARGTRALTFYTHATNAHRHLPLILCVLMSSMMKILNVTLPRQCSEPRWGTLLENVKAASSWGSPTRCPPAARVGVSQNNSRSDPSAVHPYRLPHLHNTTCTHVSATSPCQQRNPRKSTDICRSLLPAARRVHCSAPARSAARGPRVSEKNTCRPLAPEPRSPGAIHQICMKHFFFFFSIPKSFLPPQYFHPTANVNRKSKEA